MALLYFAVHFPVILASITIIFAYLIWQRTCISIRSSKGSQNPKHAVFYHSYIPIFGHALSFMRGHCLIHIQRALQQFGSKQPIGINLGVFSIYIVSGADNIRSVFQAECRRESGVTARTGPIHALKYAFGAPKSALSLYEKDHSGNRRKPDSVQKIAPEKRIFHHTSRITAETLSGTALQDLTTQYTKNLRENVAVSPVNSQWSKIDDLVDFLKDMMLHAAIDAVCGPNLIKQSPSFVRDLWRFDRSIATLARAVPRILAPGAWSARNACLDAIRKWHSLSPNQTTEIHSKAESGPFLASQFIRKQHEMLHKASPHIGDVLAHLDLGAIWATNANSIPSVVWSVYHVLTTDGLVDEVRREIRRCQPNAFASPVDFDVQKLIQQPLLQSIYAEVLRLYTSLFSLRQAPDKDIELHDRVIPKGQEILISTWHSQRDAHEWQAFTDHGSHPIDTFWAHRFLRQVSDPKSGELVDQFSVQGLAGRWIPYGGGTRICPGRYFAKHEIIVGLAIFLTAFDIRLESTAINATGTKREEVKPDLSKGGTGVLPPKNAIPVWIKRRNAAMVP